MVVGAPVGMDSNYGDSFGVFIIPHNGHTLRMIMSDGDYRASGLSKEFAWEHVSVSLADRCPIWEEMSFVKNLFWHDDETVIQFHPKKSEYINHHPYTLHMWRPLNFDFPLPPTATIGPKK